MSVAAESPNATGDDAGRDVGGRAEVSHANDAWNGPPARHIDVQTALLDKLARSWIDVQQLRVSLTLRELDDAVVASFERAETHLHRELTKTLRAHVLWPWLEQFPGLGGAHTALVIGRIGDPRRFPGQRCSEGHYLPPIYAVASPCPVADRRSESENPTGEDHGLGADVVADGSEVLRGCVGVMDHPRPGTGVRSLWHWSGLHVADGQLPKRRKGVKCSWEPRVRTSVLMKYGIAYQIVNHRPQPYRDIYDAAKQRLTEERRFDHSSENDTTAGSALPPFRIDKTARIIAAKAFLGDLLTEWKSLVA